MSRLLLVAAAVATCAACIFLDPPDDGPGFAQSAFRDMVEVNSVTAFGYLAVGDVGRTLYTGGAGSIQTWDVSGGALASVSAAASATSFPVFERGVLLVPLADLGVEAWTTTDDGRTWQVLGTSPIPATRVRLSGDDALPLPGRHGEGGGRRRRACRRRNGC
jgi:hypothetical protein